MQWKASFLARPSNDNIISNCRRQEYGQTNPWCSTSSKSESCGSNRANANCFCRRLRICLRSELKVRRKAFHGQVTLTHTCAILMNDRLRLVGTSFRWKLRSFTPSQHQALWRISWGPVALDYDLGVIPLKSGPLLGGNYPVTAFGQHYTFKLLACKRSFWLHGTIWSFPTQIGSITGHEGSNSQAS